MPARHKITVTFPDTDLHGWLIHSARLAERTPEQQIRYVLRQAFQHEKDAADARAIIDDEHAPRDVEHANGHA